jgi:hypothetical protein
MSEEDKVPFMFVLGLLLSYYLVITVVTYGVVWSVGLGVTFFQVLVVSALVNVLRLVIGFVQFALEQNKGEE